MTDHAPMTSSAPGHAPLRVGLIGAGDMARYHLPAWRLVPGVEVVAICARHLERAQARADEFGIPAAYDDPRAMLEREHLDIVDILTWRESHVELCLLAAEFGADVLCQKPLAPSYAEAQALSAALAGRVRLMVHENRRFAPHYRAIRGWIDAGKVGEIRQCVMTTYRSSLIPDADGRRASVERAAYFAHEPRLMIGEALIHQLDVLRFLLGPLRVVAARTLHTEADIPGETLATLLLETVPGHAPVALAGSYVSPGFGGNATAVTSGAEPGGDATSATPVGAQTSDRLELAGSISSVVMTDATLDLRGGSFETLPVDYPASYQLCFDAAIAHFVACLRSGAPFETRPEDNLETLRLVEDAYALAAQA